MNVRSHGTAYVLLLRTISCGNLGRLKGLLPVSLFTHNFGAKRSGKEIKTFRRRLPLAPYGRHPAETKCGRSRAILNSIPHWSSYRAPLRPQIVITSTYFQLSQTRERASKQAPRCLSQRVATTHEPPLQHSRVSPPRARQLGATLPVGHLGCFNKELAEERTCH